VAEIVSGEKTNGAAERLGEITWDSYETIIDHAVALQERNVRFTQGIIEALTGEYRQQAQANRAVMREFVERVAKRRDAFRTIVEESFDAYMDFLYAPLSYYEEALEATKRVVR
jgi:hypothetical protein